ncbi:adenylyl-sulfate reductase subunit alpha [Iocasia frigidifontis]|uniref:Adenylyl-sulfate reductase subunit alpha n=1 Tax=Iocasia fonsfrigidae TaxID=2682810 RepID=A0A8A7KB46_9FIRM|nr:adenylyl-sulfate reductase subunit alpha [Iocasia fonsfrigidae]QTL99063.1 adenylyl-sulfate reductase subunit alpha [Iocasia fonsfrigidae]
MNNISSEVLKTDLLIIGGGTAGCLAAVRARELNPELDVLILEKAHIARSGCLAAGMNAINAYINPGETPESFVKYVRADAMGLVREDLVLSMAERLNEVVQRVESWGLPIEKDKDGNYISRGRWNIKINGESLKPIIANKVIEYGARVINRVLVTNLLLDDGKVVGVMGFGVRTGIFYVVQAKAVIICTGGAAGIYKPNNDGSSHHKIWYSPFNTGAGYAMGIRAGAEMTSLEMRFIALRTKDVIAPTGTLALGFGASQINSRGERFMAARYGHMGAEGAPTPLRVYGPTQEMKEGRGPVFMDTTHLKEEDIYELKKSYLNMYPELVLSWAANNFNPGSEPIEIQGTEPYLVGGHTQSGYWIDKNRQTTIEGLYAAGDVAGGAPYKFVSGCWAEGFIAAEHAVEYVAGCNDIQEESNNTVVDMEMKRVYRPIENKDGVKAEEMEERLQKIMDEYAGGVSKYYEMNESELLLALNKINHLRSQVKYLIAEDYHQLMNCHEVIDRIDIAAVLIKHLLYRKETRWPAYQSRVDFPNLNDREWLKFVNSRLVDNEIEIIERPYRKLVSGDRYVP